MKGNNIAINRLTKEHNTLLKDPVDNIFTIPDPDNLFVWHFVIYGLKDCVYADGYCHGKLIFPENYPFKPPHLQFVTPSGRFITNHDICMSMTNYHPESWSVAWRVGSILVGVISFMNSKEETHGSIKESAETRKELAQKSLEFNLDNPEFMRIFGKHFDKFEYKGENKESKEEVDNKETDDEIRDNDDDDKGRDKQKQPAVVVVRDEEPDLPIEKKDYKDIMGEKNEWEANKLSKSRKKMWLTVVVIGLVGAYAYYRTRTSSKRGFRLRK